MEILYWLLVLWTPSLIAEYRCLRYRRIVDVGVIGSIIFGWWMWVAVLVFALVGPTRVTEK